MRCCCIENRDRLILNKIIGYCDRVRDNLNRYQSSYEAFQQDYLFQDACCMCVVQIGELVAQLSEEAKQQNRAVPWRMIKDTRNFYVHSYQKGGSLMPEPKLLPQSMDFAVSIIHLVKHLKSQRESIISNQIGRSGTSIGANIREAQYANSRADFISKLQIALKEANETGYWLELLFRTNYISEAEYQSLDSACTRIRVMLIASLNTAKAHTK